MRQRVQKILEELGIGQIHSDKQNLIVALSGGADSVCLLCLLKELQETMYFSLEAVHVEHGIRGEESKDDARFTEALCERLKVPCFVECVDVPAYSKEKGIGIEEAARELRYQVLSDYAKRHKGCIVLAHHMDDNAETVLFQMIRGSGLSGMCGIRTKRLDEDGVLYIRPMLGISRAEIESYLETIQQDYRTDSTNQMTDYDRNYIRKEIIWRLSQINPAAVLHINQMTQNLEEIRSFLQVETQQAMESILEERDGAFVLHLMQLQNLHPALQKEVIYQTLSKAAGGRKDLGMVHVEEIRSLISGQSGKRLNLPKRIVVKKEYDNLIFVTEKDLECVHKTKTMLEVKEEELVRWREDGTVVELPLGTCEEKLLFRVFSYKGNQDEIPQKAYTKWFDYDKIKHGFCIRTRQSGDFLISDTKGHRKKLKAYFIDEKIPTCKRDSVWLLAQEDTVMWVIGGRISEHIKISENTSTILEIQYIGGK